MPEAPQHVEPVPALVPAPESQPATSSAPPSIARILALQRSAGNAAVSRFLRPAPRPTVARFVGSEHEKLGNTTGTSIDLGNGVILTWGEVVALAGDEYGSVDELLADTKTPDGKARLRASLEHDGIPGAIAATLPAPSKDQVKAHEAHYIQLAMSNTSHFPDGGAAISAWSKDHAKAVEIAVTAGLANDPSGMSMAYLHEAFAQHFLTDCFSGGHIRTPRTQIVGWYTKTFAPRVAGPLITNLKSRLVEALVREGSPQTHWPDAILRRKVEGRVNPGIDNAIATQVGGMAKLAEFIGLGVAGAISGAMHDHEGDTGVKVASDDHPAAWTAFGDGKLDKSPDSLDQATKAIAEAKAQVDAAFLIGQQEGVARSVAAVNDPPRRVHFAFNSSTLTPEGAAAVSQAATYMTYRPEAVVDITGHTDPVGSDGDNEVLGQARADAVAAAMRAGGVASPRVHANSKGEKVLISTDPKKYSLNRRADLVWATSASAASGNGAPPDDTALATLRAMAAANKRADTALVLRFVPRPVEERGGTGNAPLPDWHWGKLDLAERGLVDNWIRGMVGTKLASALDGVKELDTVTESGVTMNPRDRAKEIVTALMANPTRELGDLMGEAPGP
jgi:outer membrane protein OmpA-like peptidoglycan-associated protein